MEIELSRASNGNIRMFIQTKLVAIMNDQEAIELKLALASMVDEKTRKEVVEISNR